MTPPSPKFRLIDTSAGDRLVLTVAEAGKLLGISRAFAYELVARGELPVIRLGRRVVVPKAALFAMVGLDHSGN
ncbi:MAG TPA: helix-turn-helix domain-containing protein [Acidimicrobiales bacterium]